MTRRIDFATEVSPPLAPGERLVPCLLVAGVPKVLVPAGVHPTATAVTGGTVDPTWWPGTGPLAISRPGGGTLDPVAPWLDPRAVWEVRQSASPADGSVEVEPLRVDLFDVGGAATAALSSRDGRVARLLGADVDAADDIPLDATVEVPADGFGFVGREAFSYDGFDGGACDVVARGLFGSRARPHLLGDGGRRPLVTFGDAPRHWQGRRIAAFYCRLSADGTTLYDPTLFYLGVALAGVALGGELTRWQLPIDHATKRLAARLTARTVRITGWLHLGGDEASLYAPVVIGWVNVLSLGAADGPDATPGWSPTREDFVTYLAEKANSGSYDFTVRLADGRLRVRLIGTGDEESWTLLTPWDTPTFRNGEWEGDTDEGADLSTGVLPECFQHLNGPLQLTGFDFDKIPATLRWDETVGTARGTAWLALAGETARRKRVVAKVLSRDAGTRRVVLSAVIPEAGDGSASNFQLEQLTQVLKPTDATIGFVAEGDTAVAALLAMGAAAGDVQGLDLEVDSIDWDRIDAVFGRISTGSIPQERSYKFVGDEDSTLTALLHEARLRGCALCVRYGRVAVYRTATFAPTEGTRTKIAERDLARDALGRAITPKVTDGWEPQVGAVTFTFADGTAYTWRDVTHDEFGPGKEVVCKALESAPSGVRVADLVRDLQRFAQQLLSALAEPQRYIEIVVPKRFGNLQPGDLVALSHPAIPDWLGNRGLVETTCQVVQVSEATFGGQARLVLGLRYADNATLGGYAPEAFVAPGGISGAVVTVDSSTAWGANGFAPDTDADGNPRTDQILLGFAPGARVVLSQMAESPIADEPFTVLSRTDLAVTLDGSPSAPMVAAAVKYGVMLRYAPWTDGAVTDAQRRYLYVADAGDEDLGAGDPPKRWA